MSSLNLREDLLGASRRFYENSVFIFFSPLFFSLVGYRINLYNHGIDTRDWYDHEIIDFRVHNTPEKKDWTNEYIWKPVELGLAIEYSRVDLIAKSENDWNSSLVLLEVGIWDSVYLDLSMYLLCIENLYRVSPGSCVLFVSG